MPAKTVLMEEFHLTIFARTNLSPAEFRAIQRTLNSRRLHAALSQSMREIFGRYPSLGKVQVKLSR